MPNNDKSLDSVDAIYQVLVAKGTVRVAHTSGPSYVDHDTQTAYLNDQASPEETLQILRQALAVLAGHAAATGATAIPAPRPARHLRLIKGGLAALVALFGTLLATARAHPWATATVGLAAAGGVLAVLLTVPEDLNTPSTGPPTHVRPTLTSMLPPHLTPTRPPPAADGPMSTAPVPTGGSLSAGPGELSAVHRPGEPVVAEPIVERSPTLTRSPSSPPRTPPRTPPPATTPPPSRPPSPSSPPPTTPPSCLLRVEVDDLARVLVCPGRDSGRGGQVDVHGPVGPAWLGRPQQHSQLRPLGLG